jgi:putative DNA modification/repair radical SAM protein
MLRSLVLLREVHGFAGYIHAKVIPGTSKELIHQMGMVADRISVNIEFPSKESLQLLAPQKKPGGIFQPMKQITETLADRKQIGQAFHEDWEGQGILLQNRTDLAPRKQYNERFAPAGQSTQMIIGASPETDRQIVKISDSLYKNFRMKRVYFSAYIPVNESPNLPSLLTAPPLVREHRLYQADWLMRYYDFQAEEILDEDNPYLDLEVDPKMAWALRHMDRFPIEINKAPLEELLRIPGVGTISARRIVRQRRMAAVQFDDLKKLGVVVKRAKYFFTCSGRYYGDVTFEPQPLRGIILGTYYPLLRGEEIRKRLLSISNESQISMFQS